MNKTVFRLNLKNLSTCYNYVLNYFKNNHQTKYFMLQNSRSCIPKVKPFQTKPSLYNLAASNKISSNFRY